MRTLVETERTNLVCSWELRMHYLRYRLFLGIATLTLLACGLVAAEKAEETKVELKIIKYDDLIKEIESLKCKVVVVDFWADT